MVSDLTLVDRSVMGILLEALLGWRYVMQRDESIS